MKLRIKGNSIRLRLTRSEVARFGQLQSVADTLAFGLLPSQQFTYQLVVDAAIDNLRAQMALNGITVQVPDELAQQWTRTDLVGFEADMPLPDGTSLFILIEKDFTCVDAHPREDQHDNYPNPMLVC